MAEYKYRALGWQDDDIASLNVVDEKAADNQVELQITKQGDGTINGPAIVGKDGITIDKAADSNKIEISGSGLVQQVTTVTQDARVYGLNADGTQTVFALSQNIPEVSNVAQYTTGGNIRTNTPINDLDCANKKYVDDAVSSASSLATPITFETVEQLDNYVKTSASAKKGQIASVLNTTEQRAYLIIAVGE